MTQAPGQALDRGRSAGRGPVRAPSRTVVIAGVAALVILVDQVTKTLALQHLRAFRATHVIGPVNLLLTFNRGAAFSLGAGVAPVVEAAAIALVVVVLLASRRVARRGAGLLVTVGLGLLCGGALSNLADRFVRHHHGAVVDFVQLVSWWPVFNVADACITVGAIVIALHLALSSAAPSSASSGPGR